MSRPIKVLIVDDSALIRQLLSSLLSGDPMIQVVGTANDPYDAREKIKALAPDVLTLDVEMPRMDGVSFLEKLMRLRPMPVVMVSTLTAKGAEVTLRALELGAVDFVTKPTTNLMAGLNEKRDELIDKIKGAAQARLLGPKRPAPAPVAVRRPILAGRDRVVLIGSSTGGVEALHTVIGALPEGMPPILMTQHMPAHFTASFAARLDRLGKIRVAEAEDGAPCEPGRAYLAPGGRHLRLARDGRGLCCSVADGAAVSGHRPSVDVLFQSGAEVATRHAVGVILTGMGRDGALGLKAMRDAGAQTLGQDEDSCVVYGMPRAAMEIGAVAQELPLERIAEEIVRLCQA